MTLTQFLLKMKTVDPGFGEELLRNAWHVQDIKMISSSYFLAELSSLGWVIYQFKFVEYTTYTVFIRISQVHNINVFHWIIF